MIRAYFFFCLVLLTIGELEAKWMQSGDPNAGCPIQCSVELQSDIFIGTTGGIFIAQKIGDDWKWLRSGLQGKDIAGLATDGIWLFANADGVVYRSKDKGVNWEKVMNGLPSIRVETYHSMAFVGSDLYVGTYDGLFVTNNYGDTWKQIHQYIDGNAFAHYGLKLYAARGSAIAKTSDSGKNWEYIDPNKGYITSMAVNSSFILIGTFKGLYMSRDDGSSWSHAGAVFINQHVNDVALSGDKCWVGTATGIFYSTDEGKIWLTANSGLPNISVKSILINNSMVFIGSNAGAFFSSVNTIHWSEINAGLYFSVYSLVNSGNQLIIGSNRGIYTSKDDGLSWDITASDVHAYCLAKSDKYLFLGNSAGVFVSKDNGVSWNICRVGLITCLTAKDSTLYAGSTDGYFFISQNNGQTWSYDRINRPTPINSIALVGTKAYIGCFFGIFENQGDRWEDIFLGDWRIVSCVVANGNNLVAGFDSGIWLYPGNWTGWHEINSGWPIKSLNIKDDFILASTENSKLYFTNNLKDFVDTGLPENNITSLLIGDSFIYAGTNGNGIWRLPISEVMTDVKQKSAQPVSDYFFVQNHPNPFNEKSIISFSLAQPSVVHLSIYNLLGKKICTVLNERREAGLHEIPWNAESMATGIYFICFESEYKHKIIKATLLK